MSRKRLPDDGDPGRHIDDPAIAELLDTVREARTALAIELSAAAGALEAGRPEVARDIVAATAEEMRRVGTSASSAGPEPVPATPRRGRRALLALPAVPLVGAIAMTAAAALGGSSGDKDAPTHSLTTVHRQVAIASTPHVLSTAAAHQAATTTLHRLEHVVTHHPQAAQVLAVADDLHNQLTAMIATAIHDPARLHVVRQLLLLEQHVLEASKVPGTQLALAASREIARLLALTPSAKHARSFEPSTKPTTQPTTQATPSTNPRPTFPSQQMQPQPTPTTSQTSQTSGSARKNALFGRGLFNHP